MKKMRDGLENFTQNAKKVKFFSGAPILFIIRLLGGDETHIMSTEDAVSSS